MLLGEHEHALDDKNRLTLPARLRDQLGDRVVVTRGLDGCLYVYAAAEWAKLAERVGTLDALSREARKMLPSVLPTETDHVPVLADEVLATLAPRPGETIVDCTFGAGGHSTLLAARLRGDGKLIAIDRDPTVAPYFERLRRSTSAKV